MNLSTAGIIFLLFCLICTNPSSAQNLYNIDSLRMLLAKEKSDSLKSDLNNKIGHSYVIGKNPSYDSALIYYQRALELNGKRGSRTELSIDGNIAHLYFLTANFPEALQLSLDNLKAAEQLRDTVLIFYATREILFIYLTIEDFPKALEAAKKLDLLANSFTLGTPRQKRLFKWMAYHNLGSTYQGMKNLDSALRYHLLAYDHSIHARDTEGLAISTTTLANMFDELGMVDSALYYNGLSFLYAEKSRRFDLITGAKGDRASLLEKKGKLDSAMQLSRDYYNECRSKKDSAGIMAAALLLSNIYKDRNQFDSAYSYLAYHNQLKDLLKTEEKIQKVQSLGFNELMRKTQLEQAKREYRAKIKIYVLLIGLGLIVLFSFFLLRSNNQKHKAKLEVEKAYSELKSAQAQLVQSEKMASLGELTAGIAHEIQNPLNFVNNFSEVNNELIDEVKSQIPMAIGTKLKMGELNDLLNDISQNNEKIILHGKRADAIVKGMLQHSRTSTGQKEPTDINALADEYLRLAHHGLRAKDKSFNAKLETQFDPNLGKINVVPQDIGRVLLNLINNAFYAVSEKKNQIDGAYEPMVSLSTRRVDQPSGNGGYKPDSYRVEIKVKDNGNGVPQKIVDKIFQPFFTTKPTGMGTGLGLSLSYDIVKAHGGTLRVENHEGGGATFVIEIPFTQQT